MKSVIRSRSTRFDLAVPLVHSGSQKPLFLLCNDDGVHAPGIRVLAEAIAPLGEVVVVAPHVERSASSHAISIHSPLRVEQLSKNFYAVEGTPADCIMLACRRLLHRKPSWIISGINRGANLGIDTLYSGTVHAAMEGALHGYRAMAVSTHGRGMLKYDAAGQIVRMLLEREDLLAVDGRFTINVNVPNLDFSELKGIRVAGLGRRIYEDEMVEGIDPRGRPYYWIGAGGEMFEDIPDSDCCLVDQGYATVSVLKPSLLDERANDQLRQVLPDAFAGAFAKGT